MESDSELCQLAERVAQKLRAAERRLATTESCADGWAAKAFTEIPGSLQWFECTFVTHSGAAKLRALGVAAGTLESFGAVSGANESIPIAPGPVTLQQTLQCQRWRITAG